MHGIRRLNHAVLYVSDAERSARFYVDVLGFEVAHAMPGAAFLRAAESPNDHDLGLFTVGSGHAPSGRGPGLYHLAWQVDTIDELSELRERLDAAGSLVGQSDHGVSKSLYAVDPDGIEFEVMWAVPHDAWPDHLDARPRPLALESERVQWSGVGTVGQSSPN